MKSKYLLASLAALALYINAALAASTSIVITVTGSSSTAVTCTPVAAFSGTAPAGAIVCPLVVTPSSWAGSWTLSGVNATSFTVAGGKLMVGATALQPGSYSVTATAAP